MQIGSRELYKYYCEATKKEPAFKLKACEFRKILIDFHRALAEEIILENFEFRAFARMGHWRLKKRKIKLLLKDGKPDFRNLKVNWKETKELWEEQPHLKGTSKVVYFRNPHSDGHYFKWNWDRKLCTVKNKTFYYFKPARFISRLVAKKLNETNNNLFFYE